MNATPILNGPGLSLDPEALEFGSATAPNDLMPRNAQSAKKPLPSARHLNGGQPVTGGREAEGEDARLNRPFLTLSLLLRVFGGTVIVGAFVLYLFEGWRDSDDLTRGLLLLGHTLLLTLAGLVSGHLLREAKGARLFIALALAAVPVNVAFLGGVTYPVLTWDSAGGLVPAASVWTSSPGHLEAGAAVLLAAGALLLLMVSTMLGFAVMARSAMWRLTAAYAFANLSLLIPTREGPAISVLLLGFVMVLGPALVSLRRRDSTLATTEGRFARLLLFLPLIIVGGRSLWLYAPDALFFTTLSLLGYLGLRAALGALSANGRWHGLLETLAVLMAMVSTLLGAVTIDQSWGLVDVFAIPLSAGLFSALLLGLSVVSTARTAPYRDAAVAVLALAALLNLLIYGGVWQAIVALVIGLATLGYGDFTKRSSLVATALVIILAAVAILASAALEHFSLSGWSALVLLGVAIIIAGSALERRGAILLGRRTR